MTVPSKPSSVATAYHLFPEPLLRAMGAGDPVAKAAFEGYITPFIEAEVATWPLRSDSFLLSPSYP